jgi:hypothetical protein
MLKDAERLFTELGNKRAMSIAKNNLANTCLSIINVPNQSEAKKRLMRTEGKACFDSAIASAEADLNSAPAMEREGFERQLANRLFNRGIFLCTTFMTSSTTSITSTTTSVSSTTPTGTTSTTNSISTTPNTQSDKSVNDGVSDLVASNEHDNAAQLLLAPSAGTSGAGQQLDRLLGRVKGLLNLLVKNPSLATNKKLSSALNVDAMLQKAVVLLKSGDPSLFEHVNVVGRQQELDAIVTEYLLSTGDLVGAAKVASRMFFEDEYLLTHAAVVPARALVQYFETANKYCNTVPHWNSIVPHSNAVQSALKTLATPKGGPKRVFFCLDKSGSMSGSRMQRANANMLNIYDKYCNDEDEVGFVAFDTVISPRYQFDLGTKGENKFWQRDKIASATDAGGTTNFYTAMAHCVRQLKVGGEGQSNWIVALTDGDSHDTHKQVKKEIQVLASNGILIEVVVVGVEVRSSVVSICQDLCTVTQNSVYIDAKGGLDAMDEAFAKVAKVISGGDMVMESF